MEDELDYFAKIIKDTRKSKNYSQQDIANLVGITRQAISQFENGNCLLSSKTINNIFKILDIDKSTLKNKRKFNYERCVTHFIFFSLVLSVIIVSILFIICV